MKKSLSGHVGGDLKRMALVLMLALLVSPLPGRQLASRPGKEILKSFVEDFRDDSAAGSRMDVSFTPGFQPTEDFLAGFLPLTFHFWIRGFPETVSFAPAAGREVHGATMVVLYYQKGLRSAWGQIRKGQRVNADPKDQVNPFPTMMIGLRGRAMAKVGGVEKILEAGQMVFVPAGTAHEAWNPFDEPAEFIILMFGEGA